MFLIKLQSAMTSNRNQIIELVEQDKIPEDNITAALKLVRIIPDSQSWYLFINHLLLWLGGLSLAFAGMFFIAYNWNEIGHLSKFAMVEAVIILTIASYWRMESDSVQGKVALLMATIFLGVLLALYGQTYQTGADPWQLFFNWALLMLPWAFIGRFPAIWIVWLLLLNLSIILYHQAFRGVLRLMFSSDAQLIWLLFLFNTTALICWQTLAIRWHWLQQNWAVRLLATTSGSTITWLVLYTILSYQKTGALPVLIWGIWLAAMYWFYRKVKPDLFMLAGCCLSVIVVVTTFLAKHLLDDGHAGSFLLLAIIITAQGTGAAIWLRNVHRELQS